MNRNRPRPGLRMRQTVQGARSARTSPVAILRALSCRSTGGILAIGMRTWRCAIGRSGLSARKREGDGATPIGRWRMLAAHYRADRRLPPRTGLPLRRIRANDGWCDDVRDRNYNRRVRHPYPTSAERLFRDDGLYDLVVVLDYNIRPRVAGRGSAIFLHIAHRDYRPTAGCIALSPRDLEQVLAICSRRTTIVAGRPGIIGQPFEPLTKGLEQ